MSPVSAVVTTGIYCRDDCPARPHPSNVIGYQFAAAAESDGFRACHRCRPYRVELDGSQAGPELVCRGIQLVADGALDNTTEGRLGARLGVSPRHLRRLFVEHTGVTPGQLARSRRAHFARRLLDDTDLRIAEIAFAAGFGSVRQLNRVLAEIFGAAPGDLRGRRRAADRLQADGGLALRLAHARPLDFDAALRHLADRAIPTVENVTSTAYRRTITVDDAPGVIEITRRSASELLLVAHLPRLGGLLHHVRRARRIFSLDSPARLPGTWDPFEIGVHGIVSADTRDPATTRVILGQIATRLGHPVTGLDQLGLSRTFPAPDQLARSGLDGLPVSAQAARDLRSFAAAVATDAIRLDHSWSGAWFQQAFRESGLSPRLAASTGLALPMPG